MKDPEYPRKETNLKLDLCFITKSGNQTHLNKINFWWTKSIYLPPDERFYPSLFSLREHRHKFGYN